MKNELLIEDLEKINTQDKLQKEIVES